VNWYPIKDSNGIPERLLGANGFLESMRQSSQKETPLTALTEGGRYF
jgi:hypothetical protein